MHTITVVALALGLLTAATAQAQSHPCDQVYTQNLSVAGFQGRAAFCHDGKDVSGNVVPVFGFTVYIDGVKAWSGPLTPIGLPSPTGFSYYETPLYTVARGTHVLTVTASDQDGESIPSNPFAFGIVGLVPTPPRVLTIKK